VEYRPVRVHTTHGRLSLPVGHRAFRGDDSLQRSVRGPGSVAVNAQNALATVGVTDSEYRDTVSPTAVIDPVNEAPGLNLRL